MLVLLGIALLAGVITALSPCVLPVLPLLLAGSAASESRWRPFAVIAGLVVSFTTFTLAGAALLSALGLPADLLRTLAIAMLFVLAASLLSQNVARILERPFLFLTRRPLARESSGFAVGVSAGVVMVPCAGPVLAAVAALAATGEVTWRVVLVTTAYSIGHALPLLALAIGSQRLTSGMRVVRSHAHVLRQGAGVVVALTAIAIVLNAPERLATAVPGYTQAVQERIERSSSAQRELAKLGGPDGSASLTEADTPGAPEIQGIETWINTRDEEPLTLAGLRGRVVLVDFWTYSCINCLRTLPHLKAWDEAYRDAGLTIIGVHSPEFAFERVPGNVRSAVRRLGVRYPVALDNDFATWRAYSNQYWPAKYLIDREGRVRFHHFGEGAYEDTEHRIRRLLGETVTTRKKSVDEEPPTRITTPESYLGYERLARFANGSVAPDVEWAYTLPSDPLPDDTLAYGGRWKVEGERIVAGRGARLKLQFQAKDIFLVLEGEGEVVVRVDGRPVRTVTVSGLPRLHTLAWFPQHRRGLLELRFSPGVAGYAFTFG
ncbi:MAG TPA: cytochrome c biogenesis protein DipZ [Gaiellaceae bacterium]|nr:cytochrome c biogenesis protein DipZ [Gaiellaceae bacterium]